MRRSPLHPLTRSPDHLHSTLSMTRFFAQMKGEVELEFISDGERPAQEIALTWAGHPNTARRVA